MRNVSMLFSPKAVLGVGLCCVLLWGCGSRNVDLGLDAGGTLGEAGVRAAGGGSRFFPAGQYGWWSNSITATTDAGGGMVSPVYHLKAPQISLVWQDDGFYRLTLDGQFVFDAEMDEAVTCDNVVGHLAVDSKGKPLSYEADSQCRGFSDPPTYTTALRAAFTWADTDEWIVRYRMADGYLEKAVKERNSRLPYTYTVVFSFNPQ